jgi:hypothetical protein
LSNFFQKVWNLLKRIFKIFSIVYESKIIAIVHAKRSAVFRKIRAVCKFAPIVPRTTPISSAAMPDFQAKPTPTLAAEMTKGAVVLT